MGPKERKTITMDSVITCDAEILSGTPVFKTFALAFPLKT